MNLKIYSIFDTASGMYFRPFFMQSDGQAARAFKDLSTDLEHDVGKHPEDYTLFCLGEWDDNNGEIIAEDPRRLATALEMVALHRKEMNTPPNLLSKDDEPDS